jgi:hypothetical protein
MKKLYFLLYALVIGSVSYFQLPARIVVNTPGQALSATTQEQTTVMNIIKSLSPSLYAAIIEVDPTGSNHIKKYDENTRIGAPKLDGLPELYIDENFIKLPFKEQQFEIGHDLGHYIRGDFGESDDDYQEEDADRIAIRALGASIDGGIAWAKRQLEEEKKEATESSEKEEVESFWAKRIKHLQDLRDQAARGISGTGGYRPMTIDDWKKLAQKYMSAAQ